MKTIIRKGYKIEYAHRVYNQLKTECNPNTPCRNFHGHSGKVTVELIGRLNDQGMVIDFTDLKPVKDFLMMFDHATILSVHDIKAVEMLLPSEGGSIVVPAGESLFSFYPKDGVVLINSPSCSSEVIAQYMALCISDIIDTIVNTMGMNNGLKLRALEFSETDNNMVRVES